MGLKLEWLKDDQKEFIERGYLKNQTPSERYEEIANAIEKYCLSMSDELDSVLYVKGIADRFRKYIENNWVSFATPVLSNFGKKDNLPISCNFSILEDSLHSIYMGLHELGMLGKYGAGTAQNFSDLRPIGSNINTGGKSNSILDWIELYADMMSKTNQNCYKDDVEVLTEYGYKLFKDLKKDEKVAYVTDEDSIEFDYPQDYIVKKFNGDLIKFKDSTKINIQVTPNHNMVVRNDNGSYNLKTAEDLNPKKGVFLSTASYTKYSGLEFNAQDKFWIAVENEYDYIDGDLVHFKEISENKSYYIMHLASVCGFEVVKEDKLIIKINKEFKENYNWVDLTKISLDWCNYFFDELLQWNAYKTNNTNMTYVSLREKAIDKIQAIASISGRRSFKKLIKPHKYSNDVEVFKITISNSKNHFELDRAYKMKEKYNGTVYCVTVPSGKLIVRSNGRTLVCGNSTRRGFLTAYLSADHPEIMEFLKIGTIRLPKDKQVFLKTITTGVTLPKGWLKDLKAGDKQKRKVWAEILRTRKEIGYPYILDLENANNQKPLVYKDKGMDIKSSNICCVVGSTNILTDKGNVPIIDRIGKETNIWNGKEWCKVVPFKTSDSSDIYEVTFDKGQSLKVNDSHNFYIKENGEEIKKSTIELNIGDTIIDYTLPKVVDKEVKGLKVTNIKKLDKKEATYCFNEPKSGKGVFNGILTGQCEIVEYADYEKTFACCLSSVNAYYFDDWKDDPHFIFDMNLLLDCVIEEYIQKASKIKGFEKAVKFAKEHRAIGLGVFAFHSYLQKKGYVFGEVPSYTANKAIFSHLRKESDRASKWMALYWGEPKVLKGYGFRNTTRLAQMPTKSSAFIMGGTTMNYSEGIEPHKSNYNSKPLAKVQVEVKNIELVKLLKEKGKNTKEVWNSILEHNGSVQHLDFLNDYEKAIFRTFLEIPQIDIIKLAGQRQKYIDQGQSLNLMIHPDTPAKDINKLHLMAFEEGLKGLYYQYNVNASQEFNKNLLTCSSCEG